MTLIIVGLSSEMNEMITDRIIRTPEVMQMVMLVVGKYCEIRWWKFNCKSFISYR